MKGELHFVTSNKGKAEEAMAILKIPLKIVSLNVPEIQSLDLEEIVRAKAAKAFDLIGQPLFVEDTGLFIDAWNGFPGPFIKYLKDVVGNEGMLKMLEVESNRKATAKAAVAFYDGNELSVFLGEVEGNIVRKARGESWGWDSLFVPDGSEKTYAELSGPEKNKISHRRKVLEQLKQFLLS